WSLNIGTSTSPDVIIRFRDVECVECRDFRVESSHKALADLHRHTQ
ncbi:12388_t:CDS:1, partial [Ambispora leptoticha]